MLGLYFFQLCTTFKFVTDVQKYDISSFLNVFFHHHLLLVNWCHICTLIYLRLAYSSSLFVVFLFSSFSYSPLLASSNSFRLCSYYLKDRFFPLLFQFLVVAYYWGLIFYQLCFFFLLRYYLCAVQLELRKVCLTIYRTVLSGWVVRLMLSRLTMTMKGSSRLGTTLE